MLLNLEEEVVSLQRELSIKDQVDIARPSKKKATVEPSSSKSFHFRVLSTHQSLTWMLKDCNSNLKMSGFFSGSRGENDEDDEKEDELCSLQPLK